MDYRFILQLSVSNYNVRLYPFKICYNMLITKLSSYLPLLIKSLKSPPSQNSDIMYILFCVS